MFCPHAHPEILILGCGRHIEPVSLELRRFIRSTGMKLEAIDSVYIYFLFLLFFTFFSLLFLLSPANKRQLGLLGIHIFI